MFRRLVTFAHRHFHRRRHRRRHHRRHRRLHRHRDDRRRRAERWSVKKVVIRLAGAGGSQKAPPGDVFA